MTTTTVEYPQPGTKALLVLEFIRDNPGTSRNAIISKLDLNPNVVKKAVFGLLDHEVITDEPTEAGHHRYSVR